MTLVEAVEPASDGVGTRWLQATFVAPVLDLLNRGLGCWVVWCQVEIINRLPDDSLRMHAETACTFAPASLAFKQRASGPATLSVLAYPAIKGCGAAAEFRCPRNYILATASTWPNQWFNRLVPSLNLGPAFVGQLKAVVAGNSLSTLRFLELAQSQARTPAACHVHGKDAVLVKEGLNAIGSAIVPDGRSDRYVKRWTTDLFA